MNTRKFGVWNFEFGITAEARRRRGFRRRKFKNSPLLYNKGKGLLTSHSYIAGGFLWVISNRRTRGRDSISAPAVIWFQQMMKSWVSDKKDRFLTGKN
jgi:hypothetical protein